MNKLHCIDKKQLRKKNISFLIVTAAKPERDAVLNSLKPVDDSNALWKYIGKNSYYIIGILGKYLVAQVHCSDQGAVKPGAALLTIKEAYDEVRPKAVLMTGIAYGADSKKQAIGDILVAARIQPYQSVRVSTTETGERIEEDRNIPCEPGGVILNQFSSFEWERAGNQVWTGTVLSGEELLDNKAYKEELLNQYNFYKRKFSDVVGGEMEGAGLASASIRNSNMNWILVKSICDWADGKKAENKKANQELAAVNAMDFCERLFETDSLEHIEGVKRIRKPHNSSECLVNGYVMFYYRNKKIMSFRTLSKETGISEAMLRGFEKFNLENGEPRFVHTTEENVKRLKTALQCGEAICNPKTSAKEVFFFKNKDAGSFFPTTNKKAIFLDFEGTLTKNREKLSSWQLIWQYLGYDLNICDRYHRKYTNKEMEHQEWCNKTAEFFIERGLNRDMMKEISGFLTLVDGVEETLQILKDKGNFIFLCSGAVDDIIRNVLGETAELFDEIKANEFFYDETGKLKKIIGTKYDFEGKAAYIAETAKRLDIPIEDCLFVGNSNNDKYVSECGAKTLVVNPRLTDGFNREVWNYYLGEISNFRAVLPFALPEFYTYKKQY